MKRIPVLLAPILFIVSIYAMNCGKQEQKQTAVIPLPEHPRPDFLREQWMNLNGVWDFSLDSLAVGESEGWHKSETPFPQNITVPFSWASPLSGIGNKDVHYGWYGRTIEAPGDFHGKHVYLVFGASDCVTTVWMNGDIVGEHEGGYTPFDFDITDFLRPDGGNRLVVRVEDEPKPGRLVGKQVYGQAKGIWQTVYLEARPALHIAKAHFSPDVKGGQVVVDIGLSQTAEGETAVVLDFADAGVGTVRLVVPDGEDGLTMPIPIDNPHLWSLDDPYLYDVDVALEQSGGEIDRVSTYFGMRSIGTAKLPGSDDVYITLNGKPVYLYMALDQSYHADGFYTFPSDAFMKEEIERAKRIGLNALRIHIKAEMPRKLYWADRLGLLIMQDVPNIGGEPKGYGRSNWEYTAWRMIERDFNHPSIFSWVLFNESWGLTTRVEKEPGKFVGEYTKATQEWVKSLYGKAKELDPTRLVEDNSPDQNRRWHVATDINSWHAYIPGYRWREFMDNVVKNTFPGSQWNYIAPYRQDGAPMMNSECGNVWGYTGGTGDVDIAYEYHIMMNEYKRRPKICGFIFTEFHDVINEWNGYYRFDRSMKDFGLGELCPGMTVRDLHSDSYLIPGADFKTVVRPGERFTVPVTASLLTDEVPETLTVRTVLHGWDRYGEHAEYAEERMTFTAKAYTTTALRPVELTAPGEACLAMVNTYLEDGQGNVLHRNFTPVRVTEGLPPRMEMLDDRTVLRETPGAFSTAEWTVKRHSVLDGLKVWGTGTGFFEYEFPWPEGLAPGDVAGVEFVAELASRKVQGKDMDDDFERMGISNISTRGIDPGHNPNSCPMTDTTRHSSDLTITLNDTGTANVRLDNDPADHRGVLSWLNQKEDGTLSEAGSYGYLVRVRFEGEAVAKAARDSVFRIRLAVGEASETTGGLSVYGESFGRFPVDPTLVITKK